MPARDAARRFLRLAADARLPQPSGDRPKRVKTGTLDDASLRRVSDAAISQPPAASPAFHLLAKPTGAVCNLDCSYCFFLSKEMLYPGSRFRMADELLETYVRQLIEAHSRVPVVEVAWQGGEPTLMGLDFFRRSVELVDRYLQPGQQAAYTIQTNGTKLDGEWAAFLRRHEFLVWHLDRRPPRGPRHIPCHERRTRQLRSGDARARGASRCGCCVQRADHGARGQRAPRWRGVSVPAR